MSHDNVKPEDTFQILLATDCHLGFLEQDAVRGQDSITTFEEILQIAIAKDVDFILLGGDLFHDNKPSRKTMYQCMSLLRKYCMGDRPIQFQFLSDQSENFKHCSFPVVNYEDPNFNVSIPVFSIHGNHDDPAGTGTFCSLDLLSVSGLVNYFGKCVDLESVQVAPLLLQKGCTKLALYGLGSIRDERLHRLFREGKVSMLRPRENSNEWFNLFTLHQNRVKHGVTNYIPEQFLDSFLDLVVWGHEHECRIKEEWNGQQSFYVTQPGSSVATSLCHGEAVSKHVGLLQIHKKTFKITEIPLKTVRQFYITDIDLEDTGLNLETPDISEKSIEYFKEVIEGLLIKSATERSNHPKQPEKPLIRLRVSYPENFQTFSVQRFGQSFVDKVANAKDIIHFTRKKKEKVKTSAIDADALRTILKQEGIDKSRVEDLVKQYFQKADDSKKLSLLSENGVGNAIQEYVDKEVNEAIQVLVSHQLMKVQSHLKEHQVEEQLIDHEIHNFKQERLGSSADVSEFQAALKSKHSLNVSNDPFMDDDTIELVPKATRGRGRGRGRGSRAGAKSGTANGSTTSRRKANESSASIRSRGGKSASRLTSGRQASIRKFMDEDSDVECLDDSDEDQKLIRQKSPRATAQRHIMYMSDDD